MDASAIVALSALAFTMVTAVVGATAWLSSKIGAVREDIVRLQTEFGHVHQEIASLREVDEDTRNRVSGFHERLLRVEVHHVGAGQ